MPAEKTWCTLANPLLNTWKGLDLLLWLCRFAASFNLNNSAWRWSIFCNIIQTVKLKPQTLEHTCSTPNHLLFLFCNKFCEVLLHLPSTSINCNMQKYETNESWEREREITLLCTSSVVSFTLFSLHIAAAILQVML